MKLHLLLALLPLGACIPAPATAPTPGPTPLERARALTVADVRPLLVPRPDSAGRVRVAVFTTYPGYRTAEAMTLPELWVTLAGEVRDSCAHFGDGRESAETVKLLGLLPGDEAGRYFAELEVPLASLARPAPDPDPTRALPCADGSLPAACAAPPGVDTAVARLVAQSRASSYPFTGLGFTYNWRDRAPPYGASEFVVRRGTQARVVGTWEVATYCRP